MQILDVKKKAPKVDLGGSWAPFGQGLGKVLGGVWRLWGALGSFFGVVFSCLHLGWSSKGVLEASGLDFRSILMGLGRILGGFGMGFGSPWLSLALLGLPWLSSVVLGSACRSLALFSSPWLSLAFLASPWWLMALILILNSSWLYWLLLLSFACFGLL